MKRGYYVENEKGLYAYILYMHIAPFHSQYMHIAPFHSQHSSPFSFSTLETKLFPIIYAHSPFSFSIYAYSPFSFSTIDFQKSVKPNKLISFKNTQFPKTCYLKRYHMTYVEKNKLKTILYICTVSGLCPAHMNNE